MYCRECECMDESEMPTEDSDEFRCWQNEEDCANYQDLLQAVYAYDNKCNDANGYVISGTLGLWDGRHDIALVIVDSLEKAIEKCVNNMDYIEIMYDDEKCEIVVRVSHHDGTNAFTIRAISNADDEIVSVSDLKVVPIGKVFECM